jgi:ribosome-associated heat shock protein Hsp15
LRIDKWLWAARFFKTRSLAQQAIAAGRVKLDEQRIKPSQELKVGHSLAIRIGDYQWDVQVKALSDKRGPAEAARKLYEETPASRAERERRADLRRLSPEPAASIQGGRPTKRDRRDLERFSGADGFGSPDDDA